MKSMNPKVLRDMDKCYMIIESNKEDEAGFQQKMVLHNKIRGVLSVEQRKIDTGCSYFYDVTDKICLVDYFLKNKMSLDQIKHVYLSIITIIQTSRDFMLEQDNFILLKEYIYLDVSSNCIYLCFYESHHMDIREQLQKLTEYFMEIIDYNEEPLVLMIYHLYKVVREQTCTFSMITHILECSENCSASRPENQFEIQEDTFENVEQDKKRDGVQSTEKHSYSYMQGLIVALDVVLILIIVKERFLFFEHSSELNVKHLAIVVLILAVCNIVFSRMIKKLNIRQQEIPIIGDYENEDTIVLTVSSETYMLRGSGVQENLRIEKWPFLVGSSASRADGVVPYEGVSKQHAVLEMIDHVIMIKDLCSTNGTYVNGEFLPPMNAIKLSPGDKVTFANKTFQFIKLS